MRELHSIKKNYISLESNYLRRPINLVLLVLGILILSTSKISAQCTASGTEKIISGTVFSDVNSNGINDSESGIQNVNVHIYQDVMGSRLF